MVDKKLINFLAFGFLLIGVLGFVFAAHVITTSDGVAFSVDEDVSSFFNISVNNTDAGPTMNITQVNITLPSTASCVFVDGTNGTDAVWETFENDSNVLAFTNSTIFLVNESETKYFWFNVICATPGDYNITVETVNSTATYASNLTLEVNDTTKPAVTAINTPSNNTNITSTQILNATVTDTVGISTVYFNISNGSQVSFLEATNTSGDHWNVTINGSALNDGNDYNITVYANDSAGNLNSSEYITITYDGTAPNVTLIAPANATSSTTSAYNFTFNVSDTITVSNCSLIFDGVSTNNLTNVNNTGGTAGMYNSSLSVATHNWSVNCTDSSGNVGASSTRTLIVTAAAAATPSSSSSSSIENLPYWTSTYVSNEAEMENGLSRELKVKHRVRVEVGGDDHHVGVVEIDEGSEEVTVNISSDTVQVILGIGEDAKVDVTEDNYYDIYVLLNSIDKDSNEASLTIQKIHEIIPEGETIGGTGEEVGAAETGDEGEKDLTWLWVLIIVLIIVGAGGGVAWKNKG